MAGGDPAATDGFRPGGAVSLSAEMSVRTTDRHQITDHRRKSCRLVDTHGAGPIPVLGQIGTLRG